jgi:membrane protease subunit HflC
MSEEHIDHDGRSLHWPTILLGVVIAVVFLIAIFSYQLKSTEYAVISTLGNVKLETEAGLHFRLPYPIQEIFYYDNRDRCFEGSVGRIEETYTKDEQNIIVGIYVKYQIVNPVTLFKSNKNIAEAEEALNSLMRNDKNRIVGKYNFSQFINTNPKEMKINDIENDIKDLLEDTALNQYGLKIKSVGITNLGLPETVTADVIKRMKAEREEAAQAFLSEGDTKAKKIKDQANADKQNILSIAKAKAKTIKAEGDAKAAEFYAVFNQEPELAIFLKKLESLKKIAKSRTTLVLDTDTAPFNLLKPNAEKLKKSKGSK